MKKVLFLVLSLMTFVACEYDDTPIWEQLNDHKTRIENLESICNQMNTNISSMQAILEALQMNDYISSITPIMEGDAVIGYTINFVKSGAVTIYHGEDGENGRDGQNGKDGADGNDGVDGKDGQDGQNGIDGVDGKDGADVKDGQDGKDGVDGADGHSPVIGVKKDSDGYYYWTIDGDWLLDENGDKIKAVGTDGKDGSDGKDSIAPKLKIEEGFWYVSYDNGQTWDKLYKAVGDNGKNGDPFFESVTISEDVVSFVLANGQTFDVPVYQQIKITFDVKDNETVVAAGETIIINYTLQNTTETTVVSASSDGNYKVKIKPNGSTSGSIYVECPDQYVDGYINIIVSDGYGYSYLHVISFFEKKMSLNKGYEYSVSAEGGNVEIPLSTNFDYRVKIGSDAKSWVNVVETKTAQRQGYIQLAVSRNDAMSARKGTLSVYAQNNPDEPYCQIVINQASAVFSIDKTSFVADAKGEIFEATVVSTSGLSFKADELPEWLTVSTEVHTDGKTYDIQIVAEENAEEVKRSTEITCYADDNKIALGIISIIQLNSAENSKKDMVFKVRANFANDFTCTLPISSSRYSKWSMYDLDCYVDWGDGTIEHLTNENVDKIVNVTSHCIEHQYKELSSPQTFEVRISGLLECMTRSGVKCDAYGVCSSVDNSIIQIVQWGNLGLKDIGFAFAGNTMLESLPKDELGALKNIKDFSNAFNGCKKLQTIPECFFENCTEAESFSWCFAYCDNLKTLPSKLFKNCSQASSFADCFNGCVSLESIPNDLFTGCKNASNFSRCFSTCTNLKTIQQGGLFSDCVNARSFSECFASCLALEELPSDLFKGCVNAKDFRMCFYDNALLEMIPEGLFIDCCCAEDFGNCFSDCRSITLIPEELFKYSPNIKDVSFCFGDCISLVSIPANIFDNNRRIQGLACLFVNCHNLVGESPYTIIDGVKYHLYERADAPDYFMRPADISRCFAGCSQLDDYNGIPDEWKQR